MFYTIFTNTLLTFFPLKHSHFLSKNMLSALLARLPSITKLPSNNLDFIALLVSAYPDLQPWSVLEASNSEYCGGFYSKYLLTLMHHEDGNDAAKRDEALIKVNAIITYGHPVVLDITITSTFCIKFTHAGVLLNVMLFQPGRSIHWRILPTEFLTCRFT